MQMEHEYCEWWKQNIVIMADAKQDIGIGSKHQLAN